jgi:hypothetical protein
MAATSPIVAAEVQFHETSGRRLVPGSRHPPQTLNSAQPSVQLVPTHENAAQILSSANQRFLRGGTSFELCSRTTKTDFRMLLSSFVAFRSARARLAAAALLLGAVAADRVAAAGGVVAH